jgi:purine-binding chemotaxis protein CheW
LLVLEGPSGELLALDCEQVPQPLAVPLRAVEEARGHGRDAIVAVGLPGARQLSLIDLDRLLARVSEVRGV